jgi:outer membrane protein assembly factor BamB
VRLAAGADAVLVITQGELVSRAAVDGRVRWRQPMPEGPVGLSWHADRVAVTSGAHARLYDGSGQVEATLAFPAPLTMVPVLDATRVAGAVATGRLVVFERASPVAPAWTSVDWPYAVEALTLHRDRLFASMTDGALAAFVVSSGHHTVRPEWQFHLYRKISGAPAVDDRSVYAATYDNTLHAIDRRTGSRRWHRPLGARPIGGVLSAGDRVVVTLADGSVAVIDAATGAGVARLADDDTAERLEAAGLTTGGAPALVTVTSNTSGHGTLRLWRLDQ